MERGGHQREGMVACDMGRPAGEREGSPVERGDQQREGVVAYDKGGRW